MKNEVSTLYKHFLIPNNRHFASNESNEENIHAYKHTHAH